MFDSQSQEQLKGRLQERMTVEMVRMDTLILKYRRPRTDTDSVSPTLALDSLAYLGTLQEIIR